MTHQQLTLFAPQYVGLHGFAQSGKDTVALGLEKHGYQRVAFADAVREAVYTLNPTIMDTKTVDNVVHSWPTYLSTYVDRVGWDTAKTEHPGVRILLQRMGTEVGRKMFGEDVWVNAAFRNLDPNGRYVFTDIRFENELRALMKFGNNAVLKITRPGVGPVNDHVSDAGLPDIMFDEVVVNDGTEEELHAKIVKLLDL